MSKVSCDYKVQCLLYSGWLWNIVELKTKTGTTISMVFITSPTLLKKFLSHLRRYLSKNFELMFDLTQKIATLNVSLTWFLQQKCQDTIDANWTRLTLFNQWNSLDLSSIFEADHFFGWHVMYFGFSTLLTLHFTTTCVILTLVWDRQGWALKRDGQLLVAAVFPIPRHWQYYHFLEMWITSFGEWWCCHWLRSEKWFSNFQLFTVQIILFWIVNTIQ